MKLTETLRELQDITAEIRELTEKMEGLRAEATELIVTARREGSRPTDISRYAPFTPAWVSAILRKAGLTRTN